MEVLYFMLLICKVILTVLSSIAIILLINQESFSRLSVFERAVLIGLQGLFAYLLETWIPPWNFGSIIESLIRPYWMRLASLAQKPFTLCTFSSLVFCWLSKDIFLRIYYKMLLCI